MTDLIEQVARAIYDAEIKGLEGFDLAVMESAYSEGSIEHEMACDAAKAAIAAVRAWDALHLPSPSEIEAGVREYDDWSCVQAILEAAAVVRQKEANGEG